MAIVKQLSAQGSKLCVCGVEKQMVLGMLVKGQSTSLATGDISISKAYLHTIVDFTADVERDSNILSNTSINLTSFYNKGIIQSDGGSYKINRITSPTSVEIIGDNKSSVNFDINGSLNFQMYCDKLVSSNQILGEIPLLDALNGNPITLNKDQSINYDNLTSQEILILTLNVNKDVDIIMCDGLFNSILVIE